MIETSSMERNMYFRSGDLTPAVHCPINQGAWIRTSAGQICRTPRKMSVIATVLFATMTAPGMAQSAYTTHSIVPFTAGGGNDVLARMLADELQKRWGQITKLNLFAQDDFANLQEVISPEVNESADRRRRSVIGWRAHQGQACSPLCRSGCAVIHRASP